MIKKLLAILPAPESQPEWGRGTFPIPLSPPRSLPLSCQAREGGGKGGGESSLEEKTDRRLAHMGTFSWYYVSF